MVLIGRRASAQAQGPWPQPGNAINGPTRPSPNIRRISGAQAPDTLAATLAAAWSLWLAVEPLAKPILAHSRALHYFAVMAQLTVRVSDKLDRALRTAARRMQRKQSEVVRMALQHFLGAAGGPEQRLERVRGLLGSLESGVADLADRHRDYVLESLRGGDDDKPSTR
ncbi:MAG: ribbon-helix-helix protein, CopG family [Proteobacteria bacterium]|nr:ribbon-helix-helix protein, CopG family [Pseudomonadota bacterium]